MLSVFCWATLSGVYWIETITDNFYVLNDRQAKSNPVEIVLVGPNMRVPNFENAEVVAAPTAKGIFLLRSLIVDENKLDELIEIQKKAPVQASINKR